MNFYSNNLAKYRARVQFTLFKPYSYIRFVRVASSLLIGHKETSGVHDAQAYTALFLNSKTNSYFIIL